MLKNIVRTISPFTKRQTSSSTAAGNSNGGGGNNKANMDYSSFEWDLSIVDLKQALKSFYKKHNPEKSFIVNEILAKYVGDETLLLQQLCERYQLSQQDMQDYLDQAPLKEENGRKLSRNSSFSSLTMSRQRSPSDDNHSQLSFGNKKRPNSAASSNNNNNNIQTKTSSDSVAEFQWDISNVDVGLALQRIYKKYNPTKAPNVSVLHDKTEHEILSLLRQLCKRHSLSEEDMQAFLDDATKPSHDAFEDSPPKDQRSNVPRPPARRGSTIGNKQNSGDISPASTGSKDHRANKTKRKSINSPSTSKTAQIFQTLKASDSNSFDDNNGQYNDEEQDSHHDAKEDYEEEEDNRSNQDQIPTSNQRAEDEYVIDRTKIKNPTNTIVARPPANHQQSQSAASAAKSNTQKSKDKKAIPTPFAVIQGKNNRVPFQQHQDDEEAQEQFNDDEECTVGDAGSSSSSVNHMQPVVPGKQVVPLLNEMKTNRRYSLSRISMTSMRGVHQSDEDEDVRKSRVEKGAPEHKRNLSIQQSRPFFNGSSSSQHYDDEDEEEPPLPPSSTNTQEVDRLRQELSSSKQQIQQMNRESKELMKLLKEAMDANKSMSSQKSTSASTSTSNKAIQADDKATQQELQTLKQALLEEETRNFTLTAASTQQSQLNQNLQQTIQQLQTKLEDLKADKRDLLQLINILASAPLAAKHVLESYLAKLATSTSVSGGNSEKMKRLRDQVLDTERKSLPMGERIDALLQWKRCTSGTGGITASNSKIEVEDFEDGGGESEDERYLIEGGNSDLEDGDYDSKKPFGNTSSSSNHGNKDALSSLTPAERKLYESMNVNKAKTTNKQTASKKFSNNSRDVSPNSSYSANDPMPPASSQTGELSVEEKHLILSEQYELAKKYFQHQRSQTKLSEQMHKTNLALQELDTEKAIHGKLLSNTAPASTSRGVSPSPSQRLSSTNNITKPSSSSRSTTPNSTTASSSSSKTSKQTATTSNRGNVTAPSSSASTNMQANDWVECFDPRSQRKYYYSASLKKSTWSKPPSVTPTSNNAANNNPATAASSTTPDAAAAVSNTSTKPSITASKPSNSTTDNRDQDDDYDSTEEFEDPRERGSNSKGAL